ncbi:DUF4440 domain-containing protein [Caenorhabditis elegans]|uniref:DUF4440 domain-containing protein n=1 Tax=Caenorhabditis elegans TaxID=6239 RepID=Q7YTS8_CAEEL|nr:DUF4440 domain-containing protein [Caenorhabditis elegans]CAE17683.1 DUF4440 domain-containing protein [Caenorhabditis elegans]|eukprot:NP_001021013.1 Uncharacterized protein CELE_C31H5.7 [Caenorhabditis elegans]
MRFPVLILLSMILSSVSTSKWDASTVASHFLSEFEKALNSKDAFKILAHFSPQKGNNDISTRKLIKELSNWHGSFNNARFTRKTGGDVEVSVVFSNPQVQRRLKKTEFVLESNGVMSYSGWTIKSMTNIITVRTP